MEKEFLNFSETAPRRITERGTRRTTKGRRVGGGEEEERDKKEQE